MKCTKCGFENIEGSVFCSQCASKIATPLVCPECGGHNLSDAIFCQKCASRIVPAEYCRFCGTEISPIQERCTQCKRDREGNVPRLQQTILSGQKNVVQNVQQLSRGAKWTAPVLAIISSLIMGIFLISKWITISGISSLGMADQYNAFDLAEFFNSIYDIFEGSRDLILIGWLFAGATIVALLLFFLSFVKLMSNNVGASTHKFKYLLYGSWTTLIITIAVIVAVFILNNVIKEESGEMIKNAIKVNGTIYFAFLVSAFMCWQGVKRLNYLNANVLEQKGDIRAAYDIYQSLNGFGDSSAKCNALREQVSGAAQVETQKAHVHVDEPVREKSPEPIVTAAAKASRRQCCFCGADIPDDAVFCLICGKKQE